MTTFTSPALRQLNAGLRVFLTLTVLLGIAYPLLMTGVAQVLFHDKANGSLLAVHGKVVGSQLIGQDFNGSPAYFQGRPSAAGNGYDPLATSASNYGPENKAFITLVRQRRAAIAKADGIARAAVAPDALLASGSGLDPDISPAYAAQQVGRVAHERGLAPAAVRRLVVEHTQGRILGFLGEPHVNVLELNLALDALAGTPGKAHS